MEVNLLQLTSSQYEISVLFTCLNAIQGNNYVQEVRHSQSTEEKVPVNTAVEVLQKKAMNMSQNIWKCLSRVIYI